MVGKQAPKGSLLLRRNSNFKIPQILHDSYRVPPRTVTLTGEDVIMTRQGVYFNLQYIVITEEQQ